MGRRKIEAYRADPVHVVCGRAVLDPALLDLALGDPGAWPGKGTAVAFENEEPASPSLRPQVRFGQVDRWDAS